MTVSLISCTVSSRPPISFQLVVMLKGSTRFDAIHNSYSVSCVNKNTCTLLILIITLIKLFQKFDFITSAYTGSFVTNEVAVNMEIKSPLMVFSLSSFSWQPKDIHVCRGIVERHISNACSTPVMKQVVIYTSILKTQHRNFKTSQNT